MINARPIQWQPLRQALAVGGFVLAFGFALVACGGEASADLASPPNIPPLPDHQLEECGWSTDPEAVDCFFQALDEGRGSQLFRRGQTVEGDPVYEIARTTPAGDVLLYIDSTEDRYSDGEPFRHSTCVGSQIQIIRGLVVVGECEPQIAGW